MILTGKEIAAQVKVGAIEINPFDEHRISPNTYDLTLGSEVSRYPTGYLDPRNPPTAEAICIQNGFKLSKREFVLAQSAERLGSDNFVPIIHAKSSIARLGLFVHVTADIIDLGYHGHITFQLYATRDITLTAGMPIGQVSFWVPTGERSLYRGATRPSENLLQI